jgi:hypothetical protein
MLIHLNPQVILSLTVLILKYCKVLVPCIVQLNYRFIYKQFVTIYVLSQLLNENLELINVDR